MVLGTATNGDKRLIKYQISELRRLSSLLLEKTGKECSQAELHCRTHYKGWALTLKKVEEKRVA